MCTDIYTSNKFWIKNIVSMEVHKAFGVNNDIARLYLNHYGFPHNPLYPYNKLYHSLNLQFKFFQPNKLW